MRKNIGFVLLAIGAALLAVGVVTVTWAPGVVKQTPLDVDTTTYLTGEASRLGADPQPIAIESITQVDSETSADHEGTAVFVSTQCVMFADSVDVDFCADPDDPDVLTIGTPDRFVTDRKTALAVDEPGIIDDEFRGPQQEGLVNKFPFDTQKKTYPLWDGITERSWPAEYVGTETIDGLETYHFSMTISDESAKVVPPTDTVGTYSNQVDTWVDPVTGAFIRQTQDQQRVLEDGTVALDLQAAFTDDQVAANVDEAESNIAKVDLVTKTMPIVGFAGGALLLAAGGALVLLGRGKRRGDGAHARDDEREPVSV
ncbi:DUF3068 domain-containing protein [Nocardioides sp. C4-1]|uniref:DUF3068 domain-containing protein n=1 Tax=Nocardioides sp. C4-1 TaxID=3151851 RepID=UPI0032664243